MKPISLTAPLSRAEIAKLHAGDSVLLSGVIYTARDAAHGRLCAALAAGEPLPVDLKEQTVFYAGPPPPPPGKPTGAIGPTTSVRMDAYTPQLLAYGVNALIGKGGRTQPVCDALAQNGAVYFAAIGGCAAYMAACVKRCDVVAYEDLGTESIKRLEIENMPLTVAVDCHGGNAYLDGMEAYRRLAGEG